MMLHECFYRSAIYHVTNMVPPGVTVTDGESYGVRQVDPKMKSPAVTVTIDDSQNADVELGSSSLQFNVVYTIAAKSRFQRDALKDVVYSGLMNMPITLYDNFDGFIPASGAKPLRACQLGDYVKLTDIPMFDTDREKLFWTSVVYTEYVVV